MERHPDGLHSLHAMNTPDSFRRTAWQGKLGLARSFWLLQVLGSILLVGTFAIVVQLTNSIVLGFLGFLLVSGWQVFAGVATWRAAARFVGNTQLALLARLAVLASALLLAYGTASLFI